VSKIATVAELLVKIGADSSGLKREIAASQRQLKRAFGPESLELSSNAAGLLGGLVTGMTAAGVASVALSGKMNASNKAFETLIKDGTNVQQFLSELTQFAADTPFELKGLQDSSKKLLAFKFVAQDIIPIMNVLGDTAAMLGSGQEGIDSMQRSIGQMQAKGKIQAEEVMQLAEAGVNAWQYLADSMDMSIANVMKKVTDGEVDAQSGINAILLGMQKDFKGGMEAQAKEIPGLFSTIKDNVEMVMKNLGDKLNDTLGIKEKMQDTANYLSEFSSKVQSAGVKAALLDMVPPEVLAGIAALSTAIMFVAVPALYSLAASAWAAVSPFLPLIAAGVAFGIVAYEIWKNWEPLTQIFSAWGDSIADSVALAWERIKQRSYEGVTAVLRIAKTLVDFFGGDSLSGTMADWISTFSTKAVNSATTARNLAANNNGAAAKRVSDAWGKINIGLNYSKIEAGLRSIKEVAGGTDRTFKGLSNSAASVGDSSAKAAKEAEKEWEKLKTKAEEVHRSIRQEWISTTKTQTEQVDIGYSDTLEKLKESAAANETYQKDLDMLEETYSRKRIKAAYDKQKEVNDIRDSAYNHARELQEKIDKLGLSKKVNSDFGVEASPVALEKSNINNDAKKQNTETENWYRDLTEKYNAATQEQQKNYRKAWEDNGIIFEITANGMVNFQKQKNKEIQIIEQEKLSKLKALNFDYAKWKEDIESAQNAGNFEKMKQLIESEQSLFNQDLIGRKAMFEAYYDAWQDSHRSSMSIMAGATNQFRSGMEGIFKDMIVNLDTIGNKWVSFRDMVVNIIADIYAKQMAANLTTSLLSWLPGIKSSSGSSSNYSFSGISVQTPITTHLATGGLLTGPGTGTSDSILLWGSNKEYMLNAAATEAIGIDNLNYMNETGKIPAYASGGLVTGPSLSSLSNRYDSAGVSQAGGGRAGGVQIIINNHGNDKVTATDGGLLEGIRQIIVEIAPDAVLNKTASSPAYARNMSAALGV
jgi:lambda family phage tail tape measure protein